MRKALNLKIVRHSMMKNRMLNDPFPPLPEMPLLPITSPQTVEACRTLSVTNEDIFICSYPKSGTTWTQNLVCRLLSSHVGMTFDDDWHLSHTAPFYEVDKYWNSEGRLPPKTPICGNVRGTERSYRVFNTHLRPHQLPPSAKCVYVVRDPLDVLASFYHHLANMSEEDGGYVGTPGKFCSAFVDGSILYGKWQDHLEAWLGKANSNRSSLLILNYEDMKGDLAKQTTRLARFLGIQEGSIHDVVNSALPYCTFSNMRRERWRYSPLSVTWKTYDDGRPYDNFVRTGRIGDGKVFFEQYFTNDLKLQWETDLKITRARWTHEEVDSQIIERYLGSR